MVKNNKLNIIWDKTAKNNLGRIFNSTQTKSIEAAKVVIEGFLASVDEIIKDPYKYPPDSLKKDNSGNYRAYELFNYRIVYKITEENIQILLIRHM